MYLPVQHPVLLDGLAGGLTAALAVPLLRWFGLEWKEDGGRRFWPGFLMFVCVSMIVRPLLRECFERLHY